MAETPCGYLSLAHVSAGDARPSCCTFRKVRVDDTSHRGLGEHFTHVIGTSLDGWQVVASVAPENDNHRAFTSSFFYTIKEAVCFLRSQSHRVPAGRVG